MLKVRLDLELRVGVVAGLVALGVLVWRWRRRRR
jgi:hypothetical protein